MKRLVIGILAHVDAGKTTLSEALLYKGGALRKLGRVDDKDAFLDTDAQERARGITIFSKQAQLDIQMGEDILQLTLLDTPGHVDFSAEMERTLQVLDLAVLVISGVEGVQAHTKTLWKLLKHYDVPTVIFVNKMDMQTADLERTLKGIYTELSDLVVHFQWENELQIKSEANENSSEQVKVSGLLGTEISNLTEECCENIASVDEELMTEYLENGTLQADGIVKLIQGRKLFPLVSGSALKLEGIEDLLQVFASYVEPKIYSQDNSVYCYKISRDEKGVRLAHLKITGGCLKVKELLNEEKVNDIRLYSGNKYSSLGEAIAGMVVAVPGLNNIKPGDEIGGKENALKPILEPVLSYAVRYPSDVDRTQMLRMLRELEEELPELQVEVDEEHREIRVSLMGVVQTEIITELIRSRYNIAVHFDVGSISYKETIVDVVEGVGHFEPLRHYAEVHLKMEPLELGSGLVFESDVSEDLLDKNWQRLIYTHLVERVHRGVLTGSPITDMKITIVGGRAHNKHTEGGDFRQATYRAVRQGLMQAHSRLLEPYYDYTLVIPESYVGRAMTDIDRMNGTSILAESAGGFAVLNGRAPVATMHTYAAEVVAYTKGEGVLSLAAGGYAPCHNEEEVIAKRRYDPDCDLRNPSSSVFCSHGAGTVIPWDEVFQYMHVPSCLEPGADTEEVEGFRPITRPSGEMELSIGTEEIDEILNRVSHANERGSYVSRKGISADRLRARRESYHYIPGKDKREPEEKDYQKIYQNQAKPREKYTLIDGYNVIFAWPELKALAVENIDSARDKLLDLMCNYQAFINEEVIVVFDAYKVPNRGTEYYDFHNIHVVFTKTAQTADQYIERFANKHGQKYSITVVSSDGLVQLITRGEGCFVISSHEFEEHYHRMCKL